MKINEADKFLISTLPVVLYDHGVVQQSGITEGNIHDINYLKSMAKLP